MIACRNFWITQIQAKAYALHKFSANLVNHSCETVMGKPVCMGFNETYADLGGATASYCNDTSSGIDTVAAMQAPHFCVAGHTGTLCSACQEGLVRLHTGRCCNPDPNIKMSKVSIDKPSTSILIEHTFTNT